jgi:hypothetical protein
MTITQPAPSEILKRIRVHARVLRARRALRAGVEGLALGAVAVLLLAAPAVWVGLSVAAALLPGVLVLGAWVACRMAAAGISLQDAALELEARLEHPDGSLSVLLGLPDDSDFTKPVGRRASQALQDAGRRPARALLPTALLIGAPVLALAAGTVVIWQGATQPQPTGDATSALPRPATPVDIGGSRDAADEQAHRDALGLQEQAAALRLAASALRDPARDHEAALAQATQTLEPAEDATLLERIRGADSAELEQLAEELEARASELEGRAARVLSEQGRGGTQDTGADGDFQPGQETAGFVSFPRPAATHFAADSVALAAQTPARRRLAQRATEFLELQE